MLLRILLFSWNTNHTEGKGRTARAYTGRFKKSMMGRTMTELVPDIGNFLALNEEEANALK